MSSPMPNTMKHAFKMPVELYNRLGDMGVLPKQIELSRCSARRWTNST